MPPQHYHMSEVKILLVQLITKDQQELLVLSDELLQLKLKYARDLIQLYETIAPCKLKGVKYRTYAGNTQIFLSLSGEVRMLGTLCFELHSAIAENTRRIALQTTLSPKEMLEESLLYVDKCVNYLQYESDIFVEGHIVKQAKINRDALRMVIRIS